MGDLPRACCSKEKAKKYMKEHNVKIPDTWAIWRLPLADAAWKKPPLDDAAWEGLVPPSPGEKAYGTLYEIRESPAMIAFDKNGNVWASQDKSDCVCFIRNGEAVQVRLPQLESLDVHCSGPSVVADPRGNIWCTQLRQDGCL